MVSEYIIDGVIEELEDASKYQNILKTIVEEQIALVSYLESEGFEVLNEEERDLLWYLTTITYESIQKSGRTISLLKVKDIEEAEERNYSAMKSDHMKFSEMADLLFEGYPEEDLLAFIEDTVIPDEEEFPSPVGRKVIFITMKTIIDVLTGN